MTGHIDTPLLPFSGSLVCGLNRRTGFYMVFEFEKELGSHIEVKLTFCFFTKIIRMKKDF